DGFRKTPRARHRAAELLIGDAEHLDLRLGRNERSRGDQRLYLRVLPGEMVDGKAASHALEKPADERLLAVPDARGRGEVARHEPGDERGAERIAQLLVVE